MLNARLATALVLLAACVASALILPNRWWAALLLVVLALAAWEWGALSGTGLRRRALFVTVIVISAGVIGLAARVRPGDPTWQGTVDTAVYGASTAFWLLIAVPWLAQHRKIRSRLALEGAGWMVLVPAWLAFTRMQSEPGQLLALLGIVWISDTAAYLSGRTWGRRLLAPRISPAKTWEGVAGACAAVAVYYVALLLLAPDWRWVHGLGSVALFAGVTLMGIVGDLYESWMKRQAGVKDSGTLLPGHGGVLDRIDSMSSSMPFAALLLHLIR